MRSLLRAGLALLLALVVASCGGDDAPTEPGGSALDGVTLSRNSTASLGKVYLQGLPAAKAAGAAYEAYEVLVLADGLEPISVPVQEDEGGPFFRSTLHPITPNDGGTVHIQVSDGEVSSPELELGIEPLPAAPGAYAQMVQALRTHVEQRATWAGTTIEALAAQTFDEVSPAHTSLKVAQTYLAGQGPNDLSSLVDNTGGFLSADERELLDRVFGFARFDLVLQADIDEFGAGAKRAPLPWSWARGKRACIDAGPDIGTAQELVDAMNLSALGDAAVDPDGAGQYLEALSWVLTGGGVLPGYGKVFSVAGVGVAVWQASVSAVQGVYPSRLTALTYDLDKNTWNEDDDAPGTWSNVQLTAASDGWTADASLLNVVVSVMGVYAGSSGFDEVDALRDFEVATMNSELQSELADNQGAIEFCANTWTVDVTDPDYSTGGVLSHKFDVDIPSRTLTPREVGSDALQVATLPGLFGGQDIHLDKPVEIKAIAVSVSPGIVFVEEPGDVVQISATIEDAEVTSLYWDTEQGGWNDGTGAETNGSDTRPLLTPTDRSLYPFRVEVESTSREGLRASGQPRRYNFADVRLEQAVISIAPRDTCIQPGDTVQFQAFVGGLENYQVVWEVTEGYGSISSSGLYQSLSGGLSNATITAYIAGMEEVTDSTHIDARGCNCFYRLSLSGGFVGGSDVAYRVDDFGGLIYTFFFQIEGDTDEAIGMNIFGTEEAPSPEVGETGTWPLNFFYSNGATGWSSAHDEAGVDLTITEHTETMLRGHATGVIVQTDMEGNVTSSLVVSLDLQAGRMVDGWPCE